MLRKFCFTIVALLGAGAISGCQTPYGGGGAGGCNGGSCGGSCGANTSSAYPSGAAYAPAPTSPPRQGGFMGGSGSR